MTEFSVSSTLGGSIEGSEITAATITNDKLASDCKTMSKLMASGVITIPNTSVAFGTTYIDIPIAAGTFAATDFIYIDLVGDNTNAGNDSLRIKASATDVTSAGDIFAEMTLAGGAKTFIGRIQIAQHPNTNTNLIGGCFAQDSVNPEESISGSLNTGDANIMTTAWNLRLNLRFAGASAAAAYLRYAVRYGKA